ncbi:TetR family transcriptional regulator [Saccharopolyspora griseoalba]|uniref:TetR family transcriptional regulator n=1 Tax=Saccharopolyspora griseoalba TaxID=1431848 RepID=A0ABW2LHJ6_9PSEU
MSEAAAAAPKPRAGRTPHGRRKVRSALAVAALDLFAEQGFESTTVDQIADAAGVGRRTFFRYFRAKEDVVFPGHDERLAEVVEHLEAADPAAPPLRAVGETAGIVLEMYLDEPEVSLKRFELTRQVPALRDKEIASIDGYQRVFARYLRRRFADQPSGELHAAVAAAAVVAAHNHVLRQWLRSGGTSDARGDLREAIAQVERAMSGQWPSPGEAGSDDAVVVAAVRTSAPSGAVLDQLRAALGSLSE